MLFAVHCKKVAWGPRMVALLLCEPSGYVVAIYVDSAVYPQWDVKMSISFWDK